MSKLLSVEHLTMQFGGLKAVNDVSFTASASAITAIIGPNGAGKTTVFNCLTGFYHPTHGRIILQREAGGTVELQHLRKHQVAARAKVARTFQNIRLFAGMTVLENLIVAQHNRLQRASLFSIAGLFGLPAYKNAEKDAVERARFWLDRVGLTASADVPAGSLPYGQQRKLEIVRALCTEPVLLCLDEPAAGLNGSETAELARFLRELRDEHGLAILLIEHDMGMVMGISDHIVVLDYGRKIADAAPAVIKEDPAVIRAYLGEPEAA
ncbi:ABC transporter ATP-binding protein [Roseiterribacter gracilis]|uniref:ABC transporter ATP-binding protein n=1 Tax=Roseiterribacter gracilis TaxID=2812848 RepID=A0A8S8XEU4_9PROT|nr:ABC transporter ATP-binding protein [Rhodospirillales bacterium TMPK1]